MLRILLVIIHEVMRQVSQLVELFENLSKKTFYLQVYLQECENRQKCCLLPGQDEPSEPQQILFICQWTNIVNIATSYEKLTEL